VRVLCGFFEGIGDREPGHELLAMQVGIKNRKKNKRIELTVR
jgi:hypothetical protein